MKPAPFEYCRPETLDQALELLAEFGEEALVMAGGLSLGALLNMRLARPQAVVDINGLEQLARIERTESHVKIGALVRQADVLASPDCRRDLPLLIAGLHHVGHYQTRSRGTLGGSVAHADPSAEIPLCLATLSGEVELTSVRGVRRMKAEQFFLGALDTARDADEMLTGLIWPVAGAGSNVAFEEINERRGDFAIVAAAAWAERDQERWRFGLGLGGVEDRPVAVEGRIDDVSEDAAGRIAGELSKDMMPMEDKRASADYRRHLARHLAERVLSRALAGAVA